MRFGQRMALRYRCGRVGGLVEADACETGGHDGGLSDFFSVYSVLYGVGLCEWKFVFIDDGKRELLVVTFGSVIWASGLGWLAGLGDIIGWGLWGGFGGVFSGGCVGESFVRSGDYVAGQFWSGDSDLGFWAGEGDNGGKGGNGVFVVFWWLGALCSRGERGGAVGRDVFTYCDGDYGLFGFCIGSGVYFVE